MNISINSDLSENVDYNNKRFPAYVKTGILSNYPNYRAACHWHDDFEFIYIYSGQMDYDVNGIIVSLSAGEGIFVNSKCLHFGFSETHNECDFLCVLLHPDLLSANEYFIDTIIHPLISDESIPFIKLQLGVTWQREILTSLNAFSDLCASNSSAISIISLFSRIIELIIENKDQTSSAYYNTSDLNILTAMVGYVQQNYSEKISVHMLSSAGGCCKTKCNELFRNYLNTTPLMYITDYRLQKSIHMLQNTSATISEIAYSCGFSSPSYYCETFHKHYGTTPNLYKNRFAGIPNTLKPL